MTAAISRRQTCNICNTIFVGLTFVYVTLLQLENYCFVLQYIVLNSKAVLSFITILTLLDIVQIRPSLFIRRIIFKRNCTFSYDCYFPFSNWLFEHGLLLSMFKMNKTCKLSSSSMSAGQTSLSYLECRPLYNRFRKICFHFMFSTSYDWRKDISVVLNVKLMQELAFISYTQKFILHKLLFITLIILVY